jgi:hypothetical protein
VTTTQSSPLASGNKWSHPVDEKDTYARTIADDLAKSRRVAHLWRTKKGGDHGP